MSKSKSSTPALITTLLITAGLIGGGLWYLNKTSPGLVSGIAGQPSSSSNAPRSATQLTLLGDTFSG
ncbi:MAG: hypothetical protein AAF728_11785 [Cyanobacteria bacterium P01_D01_bin.128]